MKPCVFSLAALAFATRLAAGAFAGTPPVDCPQAVVVTTGTYTGQLMNVIVMPAGTLQLETDYYRMTVPAGHTLNVQFAPTAVTGTTSWSWAVQAGNYVPGQCSVGSVGVHTSQNQMIVTNTGAIPREYVVSIQAYDFSGAPMTVDYSMSVDIAPSPVGVAYCPGATNSLGLSGTLTAQGSGSISSNNLSFTASNLPHPSFALLASGTAAAFAPLGDGSLCIGGAVGRHAFKATTTGGAWLANFDLDDLPWITSLSAGTTEYFQLYYRDNGGPLGTVFNLTNASAVLLRP